MTPYDRLLELSARGMVFGTDRIQQLLAHLGHPERAARRTLIITGTNGKGSVAATLSAAARAAGVSAGLFTSPHLVRVEERFRIHDQDVTSDTFDRLASQVLDALDATGLPLTFFEAVTVIAFLLFRERAVDLQILEVGRGGGRDATAVARPTHAVVTGIARDHVNVLGRTLASIAREKLAVCVPGAAAVLSLPPAVRHLAPPGWLLGRDFRYRGTPTGLIVGGPFGRLELPLPRLLGPHQRHNAAVAAAAAVRLDLPRDAIATALRTVRWPARMQRLELPDPPTWLDGAHNLQAATALLRTLVPAGLTPGFALVYGSHPKKDTARILRRLAASAGPVFVTTAEGLLPPHEVAAHLAGRPDVTVVADPWEAVSAARATGRSTLVAGSLYLGGAVLAALERFDAMKVDTAPATR